MFAKLHFILPSLALSSAVLAIPQSSSSSSQCDTGPVLCCNSVTPANSVDASTSDLLASLGIYTDDALNGIATGCSPLVGGDGCEATPVCCKNDQFTGAVPINYGCAPFNINI
ncbi:type 1 hydrophobin [Fomitopsis serialis]|uniref:type 1 hydrophobin n=1 Tax=Fomitopsis serialis TaxID=139415 RepID=UPI0020077782|nr:type 1 hydrophobin [Neoantrodia serialis]KAH9927574.1 type 1 hydrophobin [Neoantrodia serialis]